MVMKKSNSFSVLSADILISQPLFSGLAAKELAEMAAAAHYKQVLAGEFFFLQGDLSERIFLLGQGRLKLSQSTPDGQQLLLQVIEPGTLFGAVAMTQTKTYPVSAEAVDESRAAYWGKAEMMGFVQRFPRLALNAVQLMAEQVQALQARYREMVTERVERRLARTVLRLAAQSGRKVEDGVLIDLPLTRQDLAEMTGTTLYTVSRTLSQWEAQGLVAAGRERVVIRFPHGLVRIAEDLPQE